MSLSQNSLFYKKISFRLTFIYAALFVLSSFFILFFSYFLLSESLVQRDHDVLHEKISNYASIYSNGGLTELENIIAEEKESDYESQFLVRIESDKGANIFIHVPEKMQDLPIDEIQKKLSNLKNSKSVAHFFMKDVDPKERDEVNKFEVINWPLANGYHLQVARNTDDRNDLLSRYLSVILLVLGLVLIVASIGGFIFSNRALAPLRHLIQTMKRIYSGELNARVETRSQQDELHEITHLFNKMTEKIEQLVMNMQHTLDQVAHELKTPLTRLQASAELALLSHSTEAEYKSALADTIENTTEIVSFINTIMDISEAEAGVLKLKPVEVSSHDIISESIDLYSLAADQKNISIFFDEQGVFQFQADRNRCKQVLFNLLDNAVKYSPAGSQIKVSTQVVDSKKQICIADQGIGISNEDLSRIWDRLFRAQNGKAEKGLGLGLSLVRSICKAHGWTIEARSQPGLGAQFILTVI
ncbi:MAG: HAMP domain-containing histidine kinase [Bdellovibrio sp.]|nr:HAMP domain-containing histidine kinase [Bdellovibrio sp.]